MSSLTITSPSNGATVGPNFEVDGRSVNCEATSATATDVSSGYIYNGAQGTITASTFQFYFQVPDSQYEVVAYSGSNASLSIKITVSG